MKRRLLSHEVASGKKEYAKSEAAERMAHVEADHT